MFLAQSKCFGESRTLVKNAIQLAGTLKVAETFPVGAKYLAKSLTSLVLLLA